VDVCNATAYAHSRGVLHRDLKPGNVMLGEFGETLVVDWGLAKVVGRAEPVGGDATLRPSGSGAGATAAGSTVGTPAFMSPEQAAGRLDELGPATDVYSLGATLYYLLTGQAPVHGDDVAAVLEQVRRGEIAPSREVQPAVPEALEAVRRKAMALLPSDRYSSALALAQEVERWLADDAPAAYREPLAARAGRWARRHRPLVTAAVAVLLVGLVGLAAGLFVVGGFNRRLDQANRDLIGSNAQLETANVALQESNTKLEIAQKDAYDKRQEAERQRAVAEAVNDFLQNDLLRQTSPEAQIGRKFQPDPDIKVRVLLDRAAQGIDTRFRDQPLVEAAIRRAIGQTYQDVGDSAKAIHHLKRALDLMEEHLPVNDPGVPVVSNTLYYAYVTAGQADESLALFERNLERLKTKLGPDHRLTFIAMNSLAWIYLQVGKESQALSLLELTVKESQAKLGPDDGVTLQIMLSLGNMYKGVGRPDKGIAILEQVLEISNARPGPEPSLTLSAMRLLGESYTKAGKREQAVVLLEQALEKHKAEYGADHATTLEVMDALAEAYQAAGKGGSALALWEQTLERTKAARGSGNIQTFHATLRLAVAYEEAGKLEKALPLRIELVPASRKQFGDKSRQTGQALMMLGFCFLRQEQYVEAEKTLREYVVMCREQDGDKSSQTGEALALLGDCLLRQEKYVDAEKTLRECVAIRGQLEPDEWTLFSAKQLLGGALLGQKQYVEAEPLLLDGYKGMKDREAKIPPQGKVRVTDALERLAKLYEAWDKKDQADQWRAKWQEAKAASKEPQ